MLSPSLDLFTMMTTDVFVTAVLGLVLTIAWLQSRSSPALGWWGAAHLCQGAALVLLIAAEQFRSLTLLKFATTMLLASYALIWIGVKRFDGRKIYPLLMFGGVIGWAFAISSGLSKSVMQYFVVYSLINAAYCFVIALEFWRGRAEPLMSRWPAIVLMSISGAGFLSWIPVTSMMQQTFTGLAFPGRWFAFVVLVTILGKVAFALIVLAMAKERLELRQMNEALTDALTGLPNRRGFFRQALRRMRQRREAGAPVSVLLFDLDHFKSVNDRYGHGFGDRILIVFAEVLSERLKGVDVIGRVGGEEFAALLPETGMLEASLVAERVRAAFQTDATTIEGTTVRATVSVGVVSTESEDCSLHHLLANADVALYAAKAAGRNCVRVVESCQAPAAEDGADLPSVAAPQLWPAAAVLDLAAKRATANQ